MKGLNISKYDLEGVKGKIHTIREVIIPPFVTTVAKDIINLMTHSKCMNVVGKPVMGYLHHVTMARSYGVLKPGRCKINVCLRNHSAKQIPLPKWTAEREIIAANIILALLEPKPTGHESGKCKASTGKGNMESKRIVGKKLT